MKTKNTIYNTVNVVYKGGYDTDFDQRLIKAAGRDDSGSGYDLSTGRREICWDCETKDEAERIGKRLARFKRVTKVNICIWDVDAPLGTPDIEDYDLKG